eukprot:s2527_g4.t1
MLQLLDLNALCMEKCHGQLWLFWLVWPVLLAQGAFVLAMKHDGSGMGSEEWSQWKVLAEIFPPLPLMILAFAVGTEAMLGLAAAWLTLLTSSDASDALRRPDASDASAGSVHGTDATSDALDAVRWPDASDASDASSGSVHGTDATLDAFLDSADVNLTPSTPGEQAKNAGFLAMPALVGGVLYTERMQPWMSQVELRSQMSGTYQCPEHADFRMFWLLQEKRWSFPGTARSCRTSETSTQSSRSSQSESSEERHERKGFFARALGMIHQLRHPSSVRPLEQQFTKISAEKLRNHLNEARGTRRKDRNSAPGKAVQAQRGSRSE